MADTLESLRAEVAALRERAEHAELEAGLHAGRPLGETWAETHQRAQRAERDLAQAREHLVDVLRAYSGYIDETETTGAAARARAFLNSRRDETPPYVCPHDRRTWVDGHCPKGCTRDEARGAPECPCLQWEPEVRGSRSYHTPGCEYARAAPTEPEDE